MTIYYRAPEVLLDNLYYDDMIDLWSAGTIIFEMLTGQVMFNGHSDIEMLMLIFKLKGTPLPDTDDFSSGYCSLLKELKEDKENVVPNNF